MPGKFSKAPRQKVQFLPLKPFQGALPLFSTIFHRIIPTNERTVSLRITNILSLQRKAHFGKASDRLPGIQPRASLGQAPAIMPERVCPFTRTGSIECEELLQESVPYNGGRQSRGLGCRRFDHGRPWMVICEVEGTS